MANGQNTETLDLVDIRTQIRKEVTAQAAKAIVAGFVALIIAALTGWWLYLKPKLVNLTGGVPQDAVLAFDRPGCPKPGWEEFTDASGRFILGVSSSHRYRVEGGEESYPLSIQQIPPITFTLSTENDARLVDASRFETGNRNAPRVEGAGKRHPYATKVEVTSDSTGPKENYDVMPPYLPLYLCKKSQE